MPETTNPETGVDGSPAAVETREDARKAAKAADDPHTSIYAKYDAIKVICKIPVSSKPAGARVTLIGAGETKDLGLTDFFPQEVLAGEYTVEIDANGCETQTRHVEVEQSGVTVLNVDLRRAH